MTNILYSPGKAVLPNYKKSHLVCSIPIKSHFVEFCGCAMVSNRSIKNELIFININGFAYP